MENEELVYLIQQTTNTEKKQELKAELYRQNKGFIYTIAKTYTHRAELEDLMQVGYIGLDNAIKCYVAGNDSLFINYAAYWIRVEISRYIYQLDGLPEHIAVLIQRHNKAVTSYEKRHGHTPTDAEIIALLNITPEKLTAIRQAADTENKVYLDTPIKGGDGLTVGDTIAGGDLEEEATESIYREQINRILYDSIKKLPQDERETITAHYLQGQTRQQIADLLKTTAGAVMATERKALERLRKQERLTRYYEKQEKVFAAAYHSTGVKAYRTRGESATEHAAILLSELLERRNKTNAV